MVAHRISQNLQKLRHALSPYGKLGDSDNAQSGKGLEGIIIPKTDPHQNEYIPAHFDRLPWITGFTGSAGIAVILQNKAGLFVDGRYTLQAQEEVESSLFDIEALRWETIGEWIKKNLPKGGRLAYDAWETLRSQEETLEKICHQAGGSLERVHKHPMDRVWTERPPLLHKQVIVHPLLYAGQSSKDKIASITTAMKTAQVDTMVLTLLDSIAWLFNLRGRDIPYTPVALCYALLHESGHAELFIDLKNSEDRALADGENLEDPDDVALKLSPYASFHEALRTLKNRRVWVDGTSVSVGIIQTLKGVGAHIHDAQDPCILSKARKNTIECNGFRKAHQRDARAMIQFLAWLQSSVPEGLVTEKSAAAYLLKCRQKQDLFQQPSFETISAFKDHGAMVHYGVTHASSKPLCPEGLYLVDSGGQYLDGTTDVTRTLALGQPTEEQKDRFTRVLKGHIALAQAHFPKGTTGHQLDSLARQYLWNAGLDYAHGTGHGVGSYLNVHEGPQSISSHGGLSTPLEPGMILSNEPGYYKEGEYGIRIESLVLVKESSFKGFLDFETLTLVLIDLTLIEMSLLTPWEKEWLKDYHQRIVQTLSMDLDSISKKWLEKYV